MAEVPITEKNEKTGAYITHLVHADFTEIEICGVKFVVSRGTSDVIVYSKDMESKAPGKHAKENATDPDVATSEDLRSAVVYGAYLEVPENGPPLIITNGKKRRIPPAAPAPEAKKEIRIGDDAGNGWKYATEPFWKHGVKQVTLGKSLKGLITYAEVKEAAKAEQRAGFVPDAHIPTGGQMRGLFRAASKLGVNTRNELLSTVWIRTMSLFPGHRKVYKLAKKHQLKKASIRDKGSRHGALLVGTIKL